MNLSKIELKVPPVAQVLVVMLLMFGCAQFYESSFYFNNQLEISGFIAAFGLLVIVAGVVQFRIANTTVNPVKPNETSKVVATGIYRWTRNPMYLGMLLTILGWFVYLGVVVNLVFIAIFIGYMNRFQIKPEEAMLKQLFSEEYEQYINRVRRWI